MSLPGPATDTGGAQPTAAATSSSAKGATNLPAPNVALPETLHWVSLDPDVASLEALASEHRDRIISIQISKLSEMVATMWDHMQHQSTGRRASLGSDGGSSRRSSLSNPASVAPSAAGPSEAGGETGEKPAKTSTNFSNEEMDLLYQIFESFLLREKKVPLISRSKNIASYSESFTGFATNEIPDFSEADAAAQLLEKLTNLTLMTSESLYIALSKRYKGDESKGRKVVKTVADDFETDRDRSASADGTPRRKTRSSSRPATQAGPAPKTPSVARMVAIHDDEEESGTDSS